MSILKLSNVSYKYDSTNKTILKGVTAEFDSGKLYAIMGKSGAGKTTLLSLISGLDICTEGTIDYNGNLLSKIDRDKYRAESVGVIFQSYNLLTNATPIENIVLSMNISKVKEINKKKIAYELLEKVGVDRETADRKILKLSGGEQQRIGIARALAHNPDIIIADEPTGNLDGETEKNIMGILKALAHDENKCVIVVTHSKKVSTYADELLTLNCGNLSF
ncbi:ABC transporter ATP-binding protein [Clostridium intestinale]|uniref:Putative ABC transport system ATP-binding protein n=1 Tax=Clostridium intestinale DSM 6191 TaxID=1121320 RepID=A0A1M5ZIB0_9CLOT|nr:ABC transporter ATP-binding protein [Clostridium intestinale]SHI23931.1 putative ABC transport system ATP-binding protein [Clostridium intestinale DSM 6191]